MKSVDLDALRRYAVARTLFRPTTLRRALARLGFVQADPIRAPARAQDLTLRHRVKGYRAGDLERLYPRLAIEEEHLVNYGFVPREHLALIHPRVARRKWDAATARRAIDVLAFIREHGATHPREVEQRFAHGRVRNYWGGSSNATTHLLERMHYRGMLRVARRESGIRVYEAANHPPGDESPDGRVRRAAALIELAVRKYAPLPASTLTYVVRLMGYGGPHLRAQTQAALRLARERLVSATVDGVVWLWPEAENPASSRHAPIDAVRLLAPFDPVVWDRRRFELLWGWEYRFEAYTPAPKRQRGYYALPLLWRDRVVGWGNLRLSDGGLEASLGYVGGRAPRDPAFRIGLDAELDSMRTFLGIATGE